MTREEAISYLVAMKGENKFVNPYREEALTMAISALREQEERRWIPVTERLPEPKHEIDARNWYLVALSNGVVKELAYEFHNHSAFGYGWRETAYPVTH